MKKLITAAFLLILLAACSRKEVKFELFSPEAFAYSLDSGFELDARTMVKGFKVEEKNKLFTANLNYSADIIMPDASVKKGIAAGVIKKEEKEEFGEVEISIQYQMDAKTYPVGKYKVVFNVTDEISKQQLKIEKDFDLTQ